MSDPGFGPRRPIRRLETRTIEQIAAGEVVERPASVVKELVENSVDAGATTVTVLIEDGGLARIVVEDNGEGIPKGELPLAVERHATSKLDPSGGIDRIESLGFRGEALAAIGSVSRLRLLSRPDGADGAAGIEVVGGKLGPTYLRGRAPGTTVEVADLFFNTPARRKFLKSAVTEQLEVVATVERLYLARPDVTYRVRTAERELGVYPAAATTADAAARVLGPGILRESFPVEGEVPGGRLHGLLGRPALATPSSRGLHWVVNGRTVVSRPLAQAVRAAFLDYLPRTRFPIGVLYLDLAPDRVDVNVHPTKREVRLEREREVADSVRRAVREALVGAPVGAEAPETAERGPRGRGSAPAGPLPVASKAVGKVAPRQRTLEPAPATTAAAKLPTTGGGRSRLRLLGCVGALYWAAEDDDGLVLVDQHAASERVVYQELRERGELARQRLVEPVVVPLTGAQRAALVAHPEAVRAAGFDVEPFGPETYRLRSVPVYRGRSPPIAALAGLLDELATGGRPAVSDSLEERTAASIACHAAIRAGDRIAPEELARVLEALAALPESAYACPHGRPIFVRLPRARLDRWFLRAGA